MNEQVAILEDAIRNGIHIPPRLMNNMRFTTTGLGGVFLQYFCDSRTHLTSLNSKVLIAFYFPTTDRFGRYMGDICGMEVTQSRGITKPRGIKVYIDYRRVVDKMNKWLVENEEFLYNSIENK